jgi:hypothetical protein
MPGLTSRHLVLDLDSTLIHSDGEMDVYKDFKLYSSPTNAELRSRLYRFDLVDVVDAPGTGVRTPMWGVYRPHVLEFLNFASIYFDAVHIWSAGQHKYVHTIKDVLFQGDFVPSTVFSYDMCDQTTSELFKPLTKLYAENTAMGANETNTLALDDRDHTFSRNPHNGVQIPAYEPGPTEDKAKKMSRAEIVKQYRADIMADDIALLQFTCWLSLPEVIKEPDVQKLDKTRIFTTSLDHYKRRLEAVSSPPQTGFFPSIMIDS